MKYRNEMEEKIGSLIEKYVDYETHGRFTLPIIIGSGIDEATKDIASFTKEYYFEFVEWINNYYSPFSVHHYLPSDHGECTYENEIGKIFTLDELFDYWYKNIKNK